MSRPLRIALAGLALAALAWFVSGFEQVTVKQRVGLSGEARLRPFLAAERFAERMGLAARELRALPELDQLPVGGVLLMPRNRQALEPQRAARLAAWAAAGNHLIVEAERPGVADPLLAALRIERIDARSQRRTVAAGVPGAARALRVSGFSASRLRAEGRTPRYRAGAPGDERLVSVVHGAGLVSAAVDLDFARNTLIGEHDNAALLWQLLTLRAAGELVVFHHPRRLSLWDFLVARAPGVLIAAAALLALWLWRIAPRYGTVLPDAPPARRRLLDHLRASGRYLWSRGLRVRLAGAAREAALHRVARAYPDFAHAPRAEQAARLAALAGLTSADAALLLAAPGAPPAPSGAEFMHLVHCAQRVHSALERGSG